MDETHGDEHTHEEPVNIRIETDHEVEDRDEDASSQDVNGEFGQLFCDIVDIHPVVSVEVFPLEDWEFHAKHLRGKWMRA